MKILVSGSTGLVGSALVPRLKAEGHEVLRLVRSAPKEGTGEVYWNPEKGTLDAEEIEGVEGVVHLAGESIAEGRWTEEKKKRISSSRVVGTTVLSKALAGLERKPRSLLSASAVGYYGNRGEEILTEVRDTARCECRETGCERVKHRTGQESN